jgi:hypothetical protein
MKLRMMISFAFQNRPLVAEKTREASFGNVYYFQFRLTLHNEQSQQDLEVFASDTTEACKLTFRVSGEDSWRLCEVRLATSSTQWQVALQRVTTSNTLRSLLKFQLPNRYRFTEF